MLRLVADENIPGIEACLGDQVAVLRLPGREISAARLAGADALLVRSITRVDEALLAGSALRFVGTATSGFDHIDRQWLAARGIGFAHAPGSNANSVVEYVLAAIAAVDEQLERLFAGGEVGIVGFGHIGRALAARLRALGIGHRVYDPWLPAAKVANAASLEQVLACQVVSLHPSLTTAQPWPSRHLLGAAQLGRLAPDSLLINASRGPVVCNRSLAAYLRSPRAGAVVLDVWEGEPRVSAALLARVRLGTAHIAGYSLDGKLLATRMLCTALAQQSGLTLAGDPGADSTLEELVLPDCAGPAAALRALLRQAYAIGEDDRRLRQAILGAGEAQAAANFDALRKHYPVRRELRGRPVSHAADGQRALLLAMGCVPQRRPE